MKKLSILIAMAVIIAACSKSKDSANPSSSQSTQQSQASIVAENNYFTYTNCSGQKITKHMNLASTSYQENYSWTIGAAKPNEVLIRYDSITTISWWGSSFDVGTYQFTGGNQDFFQMQYGIPTCDHSQNSLFMTSNWNNGNAPAISGNSMTVTSWSKIIPGGYTSGTFNFILVTAGWQQIDTVRITGHFYLIEG